MKESGSKLYRRLLAFAWPYRGRIAISMVASLGVAAANGATAKLVEPFINRIVVAADPTLVRVVPLVVIGLAVLLGVSRYFQEYFIRTAGQLVMQAIRNRLYQHSLRLSMGFFARTPAGTLLSRVLNDVGVMQAAVAEVLVGILREGATLLGLICVAFYTDWKMAAMAFVVLPVAAGPASWIGKRIKGYSRRGQGAMGILTTALEQTYSGVKVIKAFGTEEQEIEHFRRKNWDFYQFIRKVIKYDAASSPVIEILSSLGVAAVIWYGILRVMAGEMTQGALFAVMTAIVMMYTPLKRLTRVNNVIQQALGAAERVFEILEEVPEIDDAAGAQSLPRVKGEVEFDHVDFAYGEAPVLIDFTLRAAPGEIIALVGPSGAGKSTVAALINRFYDPQGGAIRIDGFDLREVTLESLKQNLALVDQETFLFNDTLGNNIRYGRPAASEAELREAARLAYAADFIAQLPEGYDTPIGDRGVRLSGGQRQRLCIARALLRDAPILVLDEATSALDTESEAMVQQALANLMQGRTTFVIAHRLSTIMHADRIVVLEAGRIVDIGRHLELLERGGLYQRLYEMQFQESS